MNNDALRYWCQVFGIRGTSITCYLPAPRRRGRQESLNYACPALSASTMGQIRGSVYMTAIAVLCVIALIFILVAISLISQSQQPQAAVGGGPDCAVRDISMSISEKKVSVLIDFSTVPKESVQSTFEAVLANTDRRLIADIVLIDNECQNEETKSYVQTLPSFEDAECKIVHIDAKKTPVGEGLARSEAIRHAAGAVLVFLAAGVVPQSGWLPPLLYEIAKAGETIAVPVFRTRKDGDAKDSTWTFTWRLEIAPVPLPGPANLAGTQEVPAFNGLAVALRRDLLEAIGGYDSYFRRPDIADNLALSLNAWLCGARIVQTQCSVVTHEAPEAGGARAIRDLSYAKYLTEVYLKKHVTSIEYRDIVASSFNADVHIAAGVRSRLLTSMGCLPFDWYLHRFSAYLPVAKAAAQPYAPNDVPPVSKPNWDGRFFALFGGRCILPNSRGTIAMEWCPATLTASHRFRWTSHGRVEILDKCLVSNKEGGWYYSVGACNDTDTSQQFDYLPETRQVRHRQSGLCATHVTKPDDDSQTLMGSRCISAKHRDIKFQMFVRDGVWH